MIRDRRLAEADNRALAGAGIVITRPVAHAESLRRRVRALGGRPLAIPGLALRPSPDVDAAVDALRAAHSDDMWIFTSPSAVRFAFRLLPELHMAPHGVVLAVGRGTAQALARHRIRAHVPETQQDADGLLALPELADVDERRIALVTAPGGRDVIAPELARRGARVRLIHVYRRVPPRLTRRHFSALTQAASPLILLISSGEALTNLVRLLPDDVLHRLRGETIVVSSARLAHLAAGEDFSTIVTARSALTGDLLDAACKTLTQHRL